LTAKVEAKLANNFLFQLQNHMTKAHKRILGAGAALMLVASLVTPALADDVSITIATNNSAEVTNTVTSVATTGGNVADGGMGGGAGDGGSVDSSGEGNTGGNGGMGGAGGAGGVIATGEALAAASIENWVNRNKVEIEGCECEIDDLVINIDAVNDAGLSNDAAAVADTGGNVADGADANGSAGMGGDVTNSGDDNTGGTGGDAGAGGEGGAITTGRSDVLSLVMNKVNTNITRIRR